MKDPRRALRGAGAKPQRGGFAVGLVVGVLIGLMLSLAVALYVTKVPIPFINKVPQRTAVQDAAEVEKNRNWDPNGPLTGKNGPRPAAPASAPALPAPAQAPATATAPAAVPPTLPPPPTARATPAPPTVAASVPARDPAAILADGASQPAPQVAASPFSRSGPDPFLYFVQAGAYGRSEDAEQQRAKLGLMGMGGKISEREQGGRTVFRVRVGPFDRKSDADAAKERLSAAGVDAALVRVQR